MKIAILGFAGQGQSSYHYWNTPENTITICDADANTPVPTGVYAQLGESYLEDLDRFDLLIRTPVLHPRQITAANPQSPNILDKVWSNTNEFFKVCPTRNVIGVTGTKGKGTTSTLITRILEKAGKTVHLGGNIGTPPLEMLKDSIQPEDWVVLELANFQLIDLKSSPHIAVCLMVVPEHMDWHQDFEEYTTAKKQLFLHQNSDDVAIFYSDNPTSTDIVSSSKGAQIPYYQQPGAYISNDAIMIENHEVCKTNELKLLGKHNWQNVCAAITATWQITQELDAIRDAVTSFSGLPFRIEFRKEVNDIRYYNDSFAATPEAAVAAVESIPGHKVMIIGGFDRNLDLTALTKGFIKHADDIRKVVLIGASAQRVADVFDQAGYTNFLISSATSMGDIMSDVIAQAEPGDAIVLSPGFPSFDMFKNFEDRGQQFNAAVSSL
jgi:UDP-N-acetylmuramoylalanine--D-glutamate ligase